jgi:hypothetical protein
MIYGKTKFLVFLFLAIAVGVVAIIFINKRYQTVIVDVPKFNHQIPEKQQALQNQTSNTGSTDTLTSSPNSKFIIPNSKLLPVPFTPQAPTANWDQLHNEACEEASAIMVAEYFKDNKNAQLDPEFVEGQISNLTKWQDEHFGHHLDTTSSETAQMIEQVYGLKTKVINNFTADDLKNELAQNHLILISEYGRALNNPNYKRPGPIHHMLLIRGYNSAGFITNDPGTKNGLNYFYTFDTLYNAAADWDQTAQNVDTNKKIAIVVWSD